MGLELRVGLELSPEASAALIGAAGGWVLAFFSELARDEIGARRARRKAGLLIYAELTTNLAAVSALRRHGVWTAERLHRTAWEAHGGALLHRSRVDRVARLAQAYAALEDVAFAAQEPDRDFTKGEDAEFLDDTLLPFIYAGMREIGPLAGIKLHEMEQRIAAVDKASRGPAD